jgi:hypothetical protein
MQSAACSERRRNKNLKGLNPPAYVPGEGNVGMESIIEWFARCQLGVLVSAGAATLIVDLPFILKNERWARP